MPRVALQNLDDYLAVEFARYSLSPGGAAMALHNSRQAVMVSAGYTSGHVLAWAFEPALQPERRWWRRPRPEKALALLVDFGWRDAYETDGFGWEQFASHVDDWQQEEEGPELILSEARRRYRLWTAKQAAGTETGTQAEA